MSLACCQVLPGIGQQRDPFLTGSLHQRRDYERTNPSPRFHGNAIFLGEIHEAGAFTAQPQQSLHAQASFRFITRIASAECTP